MSSSDERQPWLPTISVKDFISVKPSLKERGGTNFPIWKKQMLCLLESQQLVGFINGDIVNPKSSGVGSAKMLWRRRDKLVQGWILGSIEKDALDEVWELDTARDVWLKLNGVFGYQTESNDNAQSDSVETAESGEDLSRYQPLYQAALLSDWETAKTSFFDKDNATIGAIISSDGETALHVATSYLVSRGEANVFVKKLVELMSPEAAAIKNRYGQTALHLAIQDGNTDAATTLLKKFPDLLYISDSPGSSPGSSPIELAILFGRKDTLRCLISNSEPKVDYRPFKEEDDDYMFGIIFSKFFDIALDLVKKFPGLARSKSDKNSGICALSCMCGISNGFLSRESFSWWQNFIYNCIHLQEVESEAPAATSDIESGASAHKNCKHFSSITQYCLQKNWGSIGARKFKSIISKVIENLVPQAKVLRERKTKHKQALELVKYLCTEMNNLPSYEAYPMFRYSILEAAKNGISEIVEMIMDIDPVFIGCRDSTTGNNVFDIAVSYRFENVFNLIHNISVKNKSLSQYLRDLTVLGDILHICAKLAPPERLNLVPGAALQMQRELQWFQEMEKFVPPSHKTRPNDENKTPQMIFTEEHRELKGQGERWMKDTANAYTIAAALIATVVFAAAFTVPGGVASDTGIPIFSGEFAFVLFVISDVVSLFTSITSLLMFLSILTSRYAEKDFLRALPTRLSIGLLSLFVSITFMMIAFSSTMYLVVAQEKLAWFVTPVAVLTCLPVVSFVRLQFPLLVDVVYWTYGPGIFGKKSDALLY